VGASWRRWRPHDAGPGPGCRQPSGAALGARRQS
jgi:hypothetical protein